MGAASRMESKQMDGDFVGKQKITCRCRGRRRRRSDTPVRVFLESRRLGNNNIIILLLL